MSCQLQTILSFTIVTDDEGLTHKDAKARSLLRITLCLQIILQPSIIACNFDIEVVLFRFILEKWKPEHVKTKTQLDNLLGQI